MNDIVAALAMKVKEYICEPYCNIFPFDEFNSLQGRCIPVCLGTNDNVLITCRCGSGERHSMLLPIIKTLREAPTGKRIFYVFRSVNSARGMMSELMGNCQRANIDVQRFKEAEDLEIPTRTTIWTISFDQMYKLLLENLTNRAFLESISLILFDDIGSLLRGFTAELFFAILRNTSHNIRFAGISYSAEMLGPISEFWNVKPEAAAFLNFTEWCTESNAEIIGCGDYKSEEISTKVYSQSSLVIEDAIKAGQQICVLLNAKTTAVSRQKYITDTFPELAIPALAEQAAKISDRPLKLSVAAGVALITGNLDDHDEQVLRELLASKALRVVVGMIGFTEKFLDVVVFNKIIVSDKTLHPSYCAEFLEMGTPTVLLCSDQSKEWINNAMMGREIYESEFEQYIDRYLLQLIRTNCCSVSGLSDEFNETMFHRMTGVMCDSNIAALEEAGMLRVGVGLTELGVICHDTNVPYQDVIFFNQSEPPRSLKDAFVLICASSAMNNTELKEEQLPMLKQMKDDPELMFPNLISDEITEADKVSILVQYIMGVGSIDDAELQREGLVLISIMGKLAACLLQIMDFRKQFTGMKWARVMLKCALWKMWPSETRRVTLQLPGVGATYSQAFSNSGITSIEELLQLTPETAKYIVSRRIDAVVKGWSVIPKYEASLSVDGNTCQVHVSNTRGWSTTGNKIGIDHKFDVIVGVPATNQLLMFESIELSAEKPFADFEVEIPSEVGNADIQLSCIDNVYLGLDIDIVSKEVPRQAPSQFLSLMDTDDDDIDIDV